MHESIIRQMQHKLTDLSAFDQDLEFEKEMLISEINSQVDSQCTEICQNSALQQQIKAILWDISKMILLLRRKWKI